MTATVNVQPAFLAPLTPTGIKTAAYTANPGDLVEVDASGGNVPVTLPSTPADQTVVAVKMVKTAGGNTATVSTSGGATFNDDGSTSITLKLANQSTIVQYEAAANVWIVLSGDVPLSQLDARYLAQSQLFLAGVFGDGSDGAVTLDGTVTVPWASKNGSAYTLTRDVFASSLTVGSGVTLNFGAGYRVFCRGTFTSNGTLANAGNAGSATGAAGGATGSGPTGGGGRAGGAGSTGAGAAGSNALVNAGNLAGAGGAGSSGAAGAAGATSNNVTPAPGAFKTPFPLLVGAYADFNAVTQVTGAPGGGGGGGDGTNPGGGGGSGGGTVAIFAYSFTSNGDINAPGGAGGTPTAGDCGGGGGGGGGWIVIFTAYTPWTNNGTTNVAGGAAGAGVGTGAAGTAGTAGYLFAASLS
jgi:hypothetical protein